MRQQESEESNPGQDLSANGIRPGAQSGRVVRGLIPNSVRVHFQRRFLRVSSWVYPTTEKIDMNSFRGTVELSATWHRRRGSRSPTVGGRSFRGGPSSWGSTHHAAPGPSSVGAWL